MHFDTHLDMQTKRPKRLTDHLKWLVGRWPKQTMPAELALFQRIAPSPSELRRELARLRRSTCAVVGASSALTNCSDARSICDHDIVIAANDHPRARRACPRVDIQVANAFACYATPMGLKTTQGSTTRRCMTHPSIFRFRHEWNPNGLAVWAAAGEWLTTGVINERAHAAAGKCCATAGGVATTLALRLCRSVTIYGMAGVDRGHLDNTGIHKVHNARGERRWMQRLNETGALRMLCA